MPRVTQLQVEKIVDVDAGDDLFPFIDAADSLVTDRCTHPLPDTYPDEKLARITLWLSAHMYCIWKSRESQEAAGSVQASYQSKVDLGLSLTHYGSTAMRLDTYGGLAALDNALKKVFAPLKAGKVGRITWVGTCKVPPPCE